MTFWALLAVSYACQGDLGPLRAFPEAARPLLALAGPCRVTQELQLFPSAGEAARALRARGPRAPAKIYACRGFRCRPVPVAWGPLFEAKP